MHRKGIWYVDVLLLMKYNALSHLICLLALAEFKVSLCGLISMIHILDINDYVRSSRPFSYAAFNSHSQKAPAASLKDVLLLVPRAPECSASAFLFLTRQVPPLLQTRDLQQVLSLQAKKRRKGVLAQGAEGR